MLQGQVNMEYMIGFLCCVCVISSVLLVLLNKKSKKSVLMRRIQIVGYAICILLVISTILENVFFETYMKYYEIIKMIDNILFGILGITVAAEWVLNLKEMIKNRKENNNF